MDFVVQLTCVERDGLFKNSAGDWQPTPGVLAAQSATKRFCSTERTCQHRAVRTFTEKRFAMPYARAEATVDKLPNPSGVTRKIHG